MFRARAAAAIFVGLVIGLSPIDIHTPAPLPDRSGVAFAQGQPEGNSSHGRRVFKTECRNCHSVRRGKHGTFGPNLHGVVGRAVGGGEAFDYSEALANVDFAWTVERLDAWLADPQALIPDNEMSYAGLSDPTARANIIAYLIAAGRR